MTRPLLLALVRGTAVLVALASLAVTLHTGPVRPGAALAFGALVLTGELTRWSAPAGADTGPEVREPAPLGAAAALAYALLGEEAGRSAHHGACQTVAVVLAAGLLGSVPHLARGHAGTLDHLVRRVLTVFVAATGTHVLHATGATGAWGGPGHAVALPVVSALAALCGAALAAVSLHCRTRWPLLPLLREELRGLLGLGSAVCATGAVTALGVAVAGLWALPVCALPMLLTQLSFRRCAAVRAVCRQTIASLARATEIAGCTPPGHARRVAALSRAVGRDLGLTERDLTVLEHAALLHDIGQLGLDEPVPAGATADLPAAEQRRIALLGGAVVRRTGAGREVAVVVERQADPCPEQPLPARIVRAVNAYDEKARDAGSGGPWEALEELRRAGGDYAPEVLTALARVLARDGLTVPAVG
ncbi:HD-GYP domain-containing protein [Streptomyces thermodiastaticus]